MMLLKTTCMEAYTEAFVRKLSSSILTQVTLCIIVVDDDVFQGYDSVQPCK